MDRLGADLLSYIGLGRMTFSRCQINEGETSLRNSNRKRPANLNFDVRQKCIIIQSEEESLEANLDLQREDSMDITVAIESQSYFLYRISISEEETRKTSNVQSNEDLERLWGRSKEARSKKHIYGEPRHFNG